MRFKWALNRFDIFFRFGVMSDWIKCRFWQNRQFSGCHISKTKRSWGKRFGAQTWFIHRYILGEYQASAAKFTFSSCQLVLREIEIMALKRSWFHNVTFVTSLCEKLFYKFWLQSIFLIDFGFQMSPWRTLSTPFRASIILLTIITHRGDKFLVKFWWKSTKIAWNWGVFG